MPPVTGLRHIGLIPDWSLLEFTEDHVFVFWCGRLVFFCLLVFEAYVDEGDLVVDHPTSLNHAVWICCGFSPRQLSLPLF